MLGVTRSVLERFMQRDVALRALMEQRAPTEAEVVAHQGGLMSVAPMPTSDEDTAQAQEKEDRLFSEALEVMLPNPELVKSMLDAKRLTGAGFTSSLSALHGGMFKAFAMTTRERDQWSVMLEQVMTQLSNAEVYPIGTPGRDKLMSEAAIIHRFLREIGAEIISVNQVVQNSAIVLAMVRGRKKKKKAGF
jgi:hypothetical protein